MRQLGWTTPSYKIGKNKLFAFVKKIPFISISVMKMQRVPAAWLDWEWIEHIERTFKVFQSNIETNETSIVKPQANCEIIKHGFSETNDYLLVSKSRIIQINTPDEAEILAKMAPKTRYNIHLGKRHELKCRFYTGTQLANQPELEARYRQILSDNAKRIGMYLIPWPWISRLYTSFGTNAWIGVVTHLKKPEWLASALFIRTKDALFYHFNGSTELGRKWMGPSLLIWEAIRKARNSGCSWFDFEGVYDDRFPKQQAKFKGFSQFKTGFGGQAYYFEPLYRRWRWPY